MKSSKSCIIVWGSSSNIVTTLDARQFVGMLRLCEIKWHLMLNVVRSLDLLEDSSHSQSVLTFCLETSMLAKKYVFQFHWMDTCWMWTKISEANISTSFIGYQCLHTCMARLIPTWSWSLDARYSPGRERVCGYMTWTIWAISGQHNGTSA